MLEFRLNELYDIVDFFVIVESTKTFTGNDKELFYLTKKHLFDKFNDKIIHIIFDEESNINPWINESNQRNFISKGVNQLPLNDDDIIIISDIDEIPDTETLTNLKINRLTGVYSLEQDLYYYNLNCKSIHKWYHPKISNYETFKKFTPQEIRNLVTPIIENGGWHLSYFGDEEFIKNKINNFSHQEYNTDEFTSKTHIKYCIENNLDLFKREDENIKYFYIDILNNNYLPKNFKKIYNGTLE